MTMEVRIVGRQECYQDQTMVRDLRIYGFFSGDVVDG